MLDIIASSQYDTAGTAYATPCTTPECILSASVEAAKVFILEQQMFQDTAATGGHSDGGYYDD
jgi:hypothetical protein